MQLNLNVNIPNWTKWLVGGTAMGMIFGVGAAHVYAEPITVKTDWKAGDPLKAAELSAAFKTLQDEVNRLQGEVANLQNVATRLQDTNCPPGYTRDTADPTATAIVLCKKGKDEVVRVGTGNTAFWIDRYEASIWANEDGSGTQYGVQATAAADFAIAGFPETGQYTKHLYALSLVNVKPAAHLTWFQAEAACRLSGKRLPTGQEWLAAALKTPDPGENDGAKNSGCSTKAAALRNAGGGTECHSKWGAQDMIGNLSEWTGEWYVGVGAAEPDTTTKWPGPAFDSDTLLNVASKAWEADGVKPGLPSAAARGGSLEDGIGAGIHMLSLNCAPSMYWRALGFRCVIPR